MALPSQFAGLHDVFYVSMLRKYKPDPTHILNFQDLEIQDDISLEDKPIQIMDHRDQVLRGKVIPLVKVLWTRHGEEEATWEWEDQIRKSYTELFNKSGTV